MKPLSVLIVDDDLTNLKLLHAQLESEGHAVFEAHDGVDALALLECQRVDAVISDILMPRMDGYRLCLEIRKHARLRDLPILIYTSTYISPGDEKLARDMGADKYLKKPASVETLVAALHEVIAKPHAAPQPKALQEFEVLKEYNERLVSKLKEKNTELMAAEVKFRTLVEQSIVGIYIIQDDQFVYVNPRMAGIFGRSEEEMTSRTVYDFMVPEDQALARENIRQRISGGVPSLHYYSRVLHQSGAVLQVEVHDSRADYNGRPAVMGTLLDVTERKLAEEALRRSESQFRLIWENSVDGMRLTDDAGTVLLVNEAFCRLVGKPRTEIEGKPMCDIYVEANREPMLARHREHFVSRTVPAHLEHHLKLWDGREVWLEVAKCFFEPEPAKLVLLGLFRDVTGRKLAEAQMLRTQRLESIGTLAGGVAHDLNNALAPIMMASELLRAEFPDTASDYLELIRTGTQRGADMVKQLLTFAKGSEGERLLLQPRHLLKDMEKLIGSTFPKNIELRTRYAKDLRTLLGDATQLHQVLLNLCVNARDAMPNGGTLTLEAENMKIEAAYADAVTEAKPGHYVVWRVMDTGTGIPPEILDRIFEPFFTTKGPEKGTGLGLSTVIGIVKSHGGFIRVYSVPGQGTTFAIYLPAAGAGASDTSLLTQAELTFQGNGETILVVDDEAAVRAVTRAVLTALNFKVLTASDGTAALIQVADKRAELRAVITDLHMPGMDGLAFVRVLRARLPRAGIIVASGRLDEPAADEFKKLGVHALIDKPFTQAKLVEALKTIFPK